MRIGLLANTFEPLFAENAGGHVHFLEVARRWTDAEIVLFAPEIAREPFLKRLPHAQFVAMPSFPRIWGGYKLDFLLRAIAGRAKRAEMRKCDVLLCTSHFLADTVPAISANPRRTAAIVWHVIEAPWKRKEGGWPANAIAYASERASLALLKRYVDVYVVGSRFVARRLGLAAPGKRVYVTTNGVDLAEPLPAVPISRKDGLYLGRIHRAKGVEQLLRAWSMLPSNCEASRLFLAGGVSEAYKRELSGLAASLGLGPGRIVFCGRVDEQSKSSLLHNAGMFVFASTEEGWGIALAEAMAAGLPSVTYELPVFHEIFRKGRIGVVPGDVRAFSSACAELLTDHALHARLASEAKHLAGDFTWEQAAQAEMSALRSLLT